MSEMPKLSEPIIVIDDDETMRRACEAALKRAGYLVETYSDGPSGIARIAEINPPLLIVDLKMPGMSGMEVIARLRKMEVETVIVVITGFATVGTAVQAMKGGAYDFLPKPFTAEELRTIIARALERHRLSAEARKLRAEKEQQARKFVTFVSHQLKSPLGAVRQYLDVLLHQMGADTPPKQREWIGRSREKIELMLRIIADWLTLSKVEGGQLATMREPLHWHELATKVVADLSTDAQDRRIVLKNEVNEDLPAIIGDEAALRMLLSNLVNNALKYNKSGGSVTIDSELSVADNTVAINVRDNGIGIAAEQLPHVFEEFYRVTDGSTDGISGTGMGLPICRKIAEELGGGITVSSTPGQGSTFTVTLPCVPPPQAFSNASRDGR